jgi:hypothetical protein
MPTTNNVDIEGDLAAEQVKAAKFTAFYRSPRSSCAACCLLPVAC